MKSKNCISFFKSITDALRKKSRDFNDGIDLKGKLEILVKKKGKVINKIFEDNIVINNGKQKAIEALAQGSSNHQIFRMAIGSDGTMPNDRFQPKIPTVDMDELYHEVYRTDVYNPPTVGVRQATFTADFNSIDVPDSSFLNASERYINEAALIMGDGIYGGSDKYYPQVPDTDESLFSIRTFKSIPFDSGDDITITVRWTIYAQ